MGGCTATGKPRGVSASRSVSSAGTEAAARGVTAGRAAPSGAARVAGGPMGPGEYRHLTRGGAQYAAGLSVGVLFTPTGCLTASAGCGAEPRGFNQVEGAK